MLASRDPAAAEAAAVANAATPLFGVATPLDAFKLINEAYTVLSEPTLRRDYDGDRFSRTALLRRRNEGWTPGDVTGGGGRGGVGTGVAGDGGGGGSSSMESYVAWDSTISARTPDAGGLEAVGEEAFRLSLARATARYANGQRQRASAARVNRLKVGRGGSVRGSGCVCDFLQPLGDVKWWQIMSASSSSFLLSPLPLRMMPPFVFISLFVSRPLPNLD